jgi:hypothetical protein
MRFAAAIVLGLVGSISLLPAQEATKPNTLANKLTPKEIADGWILLFDGETLFGWMGVNGSPWKVGSGELLSPGKNLPLRSTCEFGDFSIEYQFHSRRIDGEAALGFGEYSWRDSHPVRVSLTGNGPGWHTTRFDAEGRQGGGITIDLPDQEKPSFPEADFRRGNEPVPIVFKGDGIKLRDIKLKPRDMKPLFNGKDLTGWHVFPGKKSTFTVEDGCIVCKNGPGDLQTDGKYGDFILQLECKVNGTHLNSGVFFRCKPNEYQNGYEAQIHNDFTAGPPKTYTVEEYDPQTHKLLKKEKVQSAAKDYGTGAIYRRVPARKSVAKDGEWFTMTIVAQGNHIATWVNGIQQVDWYDNRPPSDNPRTGCRREAGHISIQGHDPTTNLSFRNIRIAELPSKGK